MQHEQAECTTTVRASIRGTRGPHIPSRCTHVFPSSPIGYLPPDNFLLARWQLALRLTVRVCTKAPRIDIVDRLEDKCGALGEAECCGEAQLHLLLSSAG